jgi:hypothetical protein
MDSSDYRGKVPVGWPGNISRRENLATEPRRVGATPPAAYGIAVKINDAGDIIELPASAVAADIYGFIIAPEFSTHTPAPVANVMGDVMRQGYMTVKVASGTVNANGVVYARVANPTAEHPLGEIAAASGADFEAVPNARFTGPSTDTSSMAEIAFNL